MTSEKALSLGVPQAEIKANHQIVGSLAIGLFITGIGALFIVLGSS